MWNFALVTLCFALFNLPVNCFGKCSYIKKKAFQSKANNPLADKHMSYIVDKFEQVQGARVRAKGGVSTDNKFEHVQGGSHVITE